MHPSLMKCNRPESEKASSVELTGYESAQRKRYLRSEQESPGSEGEQAA